MNADDYAWIWGKTGNGSKKIVVTIFKVTLNLIEKILLKEDHRCPKICFLRLKDLAKKNNTNKNCKFNWYYQAGSMFEYIDEREDWETLDVSLLQEKKKFLIARYARSVYSKDVKSLSESSYI